jgi:hypothetical protein
MLAAFVLVGMYLLGGLTAFLSMRKAIRIEYEMKFKQQERAVIRLLHTYKKKLKTNA